MAIDEQDPWADGLDDIHDIDKALPGMSTAIREWFRNYKVCSL